MKGMEILIRASATSKIIGNPKDKDDKKAGLLSKTAKTYIEELWLENNYGYKEEVMTDPMYKGLLCEQDSMKLTQEVLGGEFRTKNDKLFTNSYIKGTPDIILKEGIIEDIKTSFNIKTFFYSELEDVYLWQLLSYMELTGLKKARLIYCLVDTPDEIVTDLKKRIWFRFNCDETNEDYICKSMQIEANHKFNNIPAEKRVKVFNIDFEQEKINFLYSKIEQARIYYNTLHL